MFDIVQPPSGLNFAYFRNRERNMDSPLKTAKAIVETVNFQGESAIIDPGGSVTQYSYDNSFLGCTQYDSH